jgi:hypothetical protein
MLYAQGLQGADRVLVEMVDTTRSGALPTECCPGAVALPEVSSARVYRCRNGARAILTADHPTLVMADPQGVQLRARLEADDLSLATVTLLATEVSGCCACECVEPYCPSYALAPRGYAFAPGDAADPDADVPHLVNGDLVYLYPTARIGAAVPVRSGNAVVGYAAGKSLCAEPLSAGGGSVVTGLAVSSAGQVTLTQSGGPQVLSNEPTAEC